MVCCDDLKRIAYFFLDGELGTEQGQEVQVHVDGCPPCHHRIVIHQRIRLLVRRRLVVLHASDQLRQRIRAAMKADRAVLGL